MNALRYMIGATGFLLFAGCEGDVVPDSQLIASIPYSQESYEIRFADAALAFLQGQDQSGALTTLENDGFNCVSQTCTIRSIYKDSTYDRIFGLRPPSREGRYAPNRQISNTFSVQILSPRIEGADDLSVRFSQEVSDE